MKKKVIAAILTTVLVVSLTACGNKPAENQQIANPWRDCTEEEAYQYAPNGFSAPEGATNVQWRMMDEKLPDMLVEMDFDLDGLSFCAREQTVAGEEITDISGMYYDWQTTESVTLANWGGGLMEGVIKGYRGDDESAQICLWFDIETGAAYSLGVAAKDLDGFDIQAVAEAIYDPAKQIGANMPD